MKPRVFFMGRIKRTCREISGIQAIQKSFSCFAET